MKNFNYIIMIYLEFYGFLRQIYIHVLGYSYCKFCCKIIKLNHSEMHPDFKLILKLYNYERQNIKQEKKTTCTKDFQAWQQRKNFQSCGYNSQTLS